MEKKTPFPSPRTKTKLKESKTICNYCKSKTTSEKSRLVCGNCRLVAYCDKTCQKLDWKAHKVGCERGNEITFSGNIKDGYGSENHFQFSQSLSHAERKGLFTDRSKGSEIMEKFIFDKSNQTYLLGLKDWRCHKWDRKECGKKAEFILIRADNCMFYVGPDIQNFCIMSVVSTPTCLKCLVSNIMIMKEVSNRLKKVTCPEIEVDEVERSNDIDGAVVESLQWIDFFGLSDEDKLEMYDVALESYVDDMNELIKKYQKL